MAKLKTVFKGKLFTIKQWPVKMPDGTIRIFERGFRNPTVIVFPIDGQGRIILTREHRRSHGGSDWFSVAGRVERGETMRQAAQRELQEEAGFSARRLDALFIRKMWLLLWSGKPPLLLLLTYFLHHCPVIRMKR